MDIALQGDQKRLSITNSFWRTQKFQSMILSNIFQTTYIARFLYFDVLKVSDVWNFAFRENFSNEKVLMHLTLDTFQTWKYQNIPII